MVFHKFFIFTHQTTWYNYSTNLKTTDLLGKPQKSKVRAGPLRKKTFFEAQKKIEKKCGHQARGGRVGGLRP